MKNISFFSTTEQIRNRKQTVTHRKGWKKIQTGDILRAISGKPNEKQGILAYIKIVGVSFERLNDINPTDVSKEGFPHWNKMRLIKFLMQQLRVSKKHKVTRIEFEYIDFEEIETQQPCLF
jgi:hypothetical protein